MFGYRHLGAYLLLDKSEDSKFLAVRAVGVVAVVASVVAFFVAVPFPIPFR